ncbi:unnamed protein product [Dovyalis caffra]|uniref:Uncharacterized protein n=1 Tax=Dovyalis caffra TaxID=77055 RepID=A0AAV1RFQ1_9ROSI|nr:unnamed protein product [Dovyalis caffra]
MAVATVSAGGLNGGWRLEGAWMVMELLAVEKERDGGEKNLMAGRRQKKDRFCVLSFVHWVGGRQAGMSDLHAEAPSDGANYGRSS